MKRVIRVGNRRILNTSYNMRMGNTRTWAGEKTRLINESYGSIGNLSK